MGAKSLIVTFVALSILGIVAYNTISNNYTTHYIGTTDSFSHGSVSSSSGGGSVVVHYPKLTVVLATNTSCLYCDVVRDDLRQKQVILKELRVYIDSEKRELLSYLNKLHIDYQGVPTVLVGHYAFYSYQQSHNCPSYSYEVSVKIKDREVKLCRLKDQPNYYVYIPDRVDELLRVCQETKDPSCFLP